MDPQIQSPAPDTTIITPIDSSNDPMPPDVPAPTTATTTTTTTTGSTTPTPPTPPIIIPPEKKFNPLIIVIVILLLIFLGVGGFLVINMAGNKTAPTPVPNTAITVNPDPPADTPAPSGNGTISGSICYPASGIPAGKIAAKDTTTQATISFDNATDSATFSVTLPVGSYKLRYEPATDMPIFGYYTTCSGSEPACQDTTTKRSSIVVQVNPDQESPDVKLCDYYYGQGLEPDF